MATPKAAVTLDDKYTAESGRVLLTGTQALVRLPLVQRRRDLAAGLNTAGFISGYRGSPLGAYDQQLWQAKQHLQAHHVTFQPGVNEDLAATACWGTQQAGLFGDAKYDGVFAIWYGKGPGVDRSGDPFKHGNNAGTARHGGVLAIAGDDHMAKSSTAAHQSELAFMDAMIPVIVPAGVQEFLDLGLYGWGMSRFAGTWVALKAIGETVDSSATVEVGEERVKIVLPQDVAMPPGGLNIRWPDMSALEQEERLHRFKIPAALAFARANRLDRVVFGGPRRRIGIVTVGKSYLDVRQALDDLGIDERTALEIGLSLYKVGLAWPLETEGALAFAQGLDEVLVVEEKRGLIEPQLKEALYHIPAGRRPRVVGKTDETGAPLLQSHAELSPGRIAEVIAARLGREHRTERMERRLALLEAQQARAAGNQPPMQRTPYFCSGCPHNSSTKVPEGSRALAGIGCHYMSQWMDRETATFTHMGGEGANWTGQAHFVETPHVFQNIGDGTYFHSGLLAIRAAVASGVNITYKVLFNDAVAMTGGQPFDGPLTPQMIAAQIAAEGVNRIVVVTDEPEKYQGNHAPFPAGVKVEHRKALDRVQKELRELSGVTAVIYDQTCAAEKRRRRKRGRMPDPPQRVFINEAVCEGCGDCGVKSNCVSVVPVETELGRKRAIDQSSCNKDFSCLNGFCPSFVTVHGGKPRRQKGAAVDQPAADLPEPVIPSCTEPYGILVNGIGGTGVITIGALLAMAAHLEGKASTIMDMTGLAQKGGAVWSHLRIADRPEDLHAVRIAAGGARLLIGCDLVVSAQPDTVAKLAHGESRAVVNSHETFTGDFTRNPDMGFPAAELRTRIEGAVGPGGADFLEATRLATALLGDSIATNLFMTGYAFQKGLIPVSGPSIDTAIELNGVAIEANRRAFAWGRRAAVDLAAVEAATKPVATPLPPRPAETLEEIVAHRRRFLTAYQNAAYADRYEALVRRAAKAETEQAKGYRGFAEAVARAYAKLLAYKDEYEVARLHADPRFAAQLTAQFEGDYSIAFHLAPPLISRTDADTGEPRKIKLEGRWMLPAFRFLARLKGLRGTPLDVFGYSEERRDERQQIKDYEDMLDGVLRDLSPANHRLAVEIAALPLSVRGFGHVKAKNLAAAEKRREGLLAAFVAPPPVTIAAAE